MSGVWRTVSGRRIFIEDGEKLSEAMRKSGKFNSKLKLANIKAEDANKKTDVLDLVTGKRYKFANGTEIRNVYVFAGKGTKKEFRDANRYAQRYGGRKEDWQHVAGNAVITDGTKKLNREVHWVQRGEGIREAFIKYK